MPHDVRFIILNTDEGFAAELRGLLQRFEGSRIVAEVDEPALLGQAVVQFPVDIVFVNLDPNPEAVLHIVGEVTANSDVAVFAASESSDGQLILQTMRRGVREFFPRPIDEKTLGDAIDKVAAQRDDTRVLGRLITVTGASGGVGATMLATNLAVELAELAEGPVTAVDLDYRYGQVATFLDVDPTYTLSDLSASPENLEPQVIGRALAQHESGVRVLSRPISLAQAETMTAASCMGVLSTLLQFNEYVVADGPTRFDMNARSMFNLSDFTVLVVQLLVPSVRNASRIIENLREEGHSLDRVKLVCNRVGGEAGQLSVQDVADTLGLKVFATVPDDWPSVAGAINLGESLAKHNPKSRVRAAVQKIAESLYAPQPEADEKDRQKKSLIGRIFAPG